MNIKSQQAKNSFLFLFIYLCSLSLQPAFATQSKEVITTDIWAATATVFKLVGEKAVNNVKLNWMQREDADLYKIYRDGNCIGEAKGNTYDDYNLKADKTFTYHVEAFKEGKKIATSASQQATTFTPSGETKIYDNLNGKYITKESIKKPQGIKIGDLYFSYKMENVEKEIDGQTLKGWLATESFSPTGLDGSWSASRELAFYPNVKFEGIAFRYNAQTGKVVLSAHYEDQSGYVAAKIYLAQITPKGELEVGTMERPLGHESRDQSLFIDDDGTAPTIVNDRTLVPVRAIIESMGGSVNWDSDTSTAMLEYNNDIITLTIGSETAYFNDNANTLDTAPQIINDRTMLPIRFIAESFKFDVEWEQGTQTITIKSNTLNPTVTTEPTIAPDNQTNGSKALVVYYSASGTTEKIAKYIANAANADIFEIQPVEPYTADDLDWTDESSRVVKEHDDESLRDVELASTTVPNWDTYDTVFIGYPIWWGIAAWPVNGFVAANDFTGKTVIPFCTSASSGIGQSGTLLRDSAKGGNWINGMRFSSSASESTVKSWVASLDLN